MMFLFTRWASRRIESGFVLHGALIGLTGPLMFTTLIVVLTGPPVSSRASSFLAHP